MFRRIVVPLDLSGVRGRAVEMAADLAEHHSAKLLLVHVVERIRGISRDEEGAFFDRLDGAAQRHLAEIARPLEERGLAVRTAVLYGEPAREIVRHADESGADLIVMDSHRVDPEVPVGWVTLSYRVGILSQCPVLLAK